MKTFLSAICIILLALFAYQVMSYPLANDEQINAQENLDDDLEKSIDYKLPQLTVLKKIDQYSEIVARPLFDKSRKGYVTTRTKKIASSNELSHLVLVGTARSSDVQIGIIADTKAKQMERLKVGENYQGWKISEVEKDYILFQNNDLEHKLFLTPIERSKTNKHAKLISNLNKSKIDRATTAIRSYQELADSDAGVQETQKRGIKERSWGYNKKYDQKRDTSSKAASKNKPVTRSPIKIPDEDDDKDAAYYEGEGDVSEKTEVAKKELSLEDFYEDEDISEDELKALEALGAKIFDD